MEKQIKKKRRVKALQGSPFYISLEPYDVIGKGSFSQIVRAFDQSHPQKELVAKIITNNNPHKLQSIKSQIQILKKIPNHQNLTNCLKYRLSSESKFYFIMQYCNGETLQKYINRNIGKISQDEVKLFLGQFCAGYKVLYENGIVHRDLKPQNILIHNNIYKIADFGLSKLIQLTRQQKQINNCSIKGTPLYMAPQLYYQKDFSSKLDVYSLGIILYRMVYNGDFPFYQKQKIYQTLESFMKYTLTAKLNFPKKKISQQLQQLIKRMLQRNKQKRLSWQQIFKSDYIKDKQNYFCYGHMLKSKIKQTFHIKNYIVSNVSKINMKKIDQSDDFQCLQTDFSTNPAIQTRLNFYRSIIILIDRVCKKTIKFIQSLDIYRKNSPISKQLNNVIMAAIGYMKQLNYEMQSISGQWSQMDKIDIQKLQKLFQEDRQYIQQFYQLMIKQCPYYPQHFKDQLAIFKDKLYCQLVSFQQIKALPKNISKMGIKCLAYFSDLYLFGVKEQKSRFWNYRNKGIQFVRYIEQIENGQDQQIKKYLLSNLQKCGINFVI